MDAASSPTPTPPSGEGVPAPRRIDPGLLLATVLLLTVVTALLSVRPWRRSQVAWQPDLAAALADSTKTGDLVFVELYADWCGPCRQMERDTFSEPAVGRTLGRLRPVRLNSDHADVRLLMDRWGVFALPTHLLINPNGTVHAQVPGYMPPDQFVAWLRQATRQRK